jgi:RecA/RadA recombinase
METEKDRMKYQLELLIDIIDHRLTRKQLTAKRDYFDNELRKLKASNNPNELNKIEKSEFLKKTLKSISQCSPNTYGKVTVINEGNSNALLIEIYGSGYLDRITLTLRAIASIQKLGGIAAFIDVKHDFDRNYAEELGVDIENLIISQPDNNNEALEVSDNLIRCGAIDIIAISSTSQLTI